MFDRMIDWYFQRKIRRKRSTLPRLDWQSLLKRIQHDIDGHTVWFETRDDQFVAVASEGDKTNLDVIGLVVAWVRDDVQPWEMEAPARRLRDQLSGLDGVSAMVFVSRRIEPFAGYYVRLRPAEISSSPTDGSVAV